MATSKRSKNTKRAGGRIQGGQGGGGQQAGGSRLRGKSGKGTGEVYTAEGASEKTNSNRKGLAFCYVSGGTLSPFGQAAVVTGGAAGEGIGTSALIAILAGGGALAAGLIWAFHGGGNPSPH